MKTTPKPTTQSPQKPQSQSQRPRPLKFERIKKQSSALTLPLPMPFSHNSNQTHSHISNTTNVLPSHSHQSLMQVHQQQQSYQAVGRIGDVLTHRRQNFVHDQEAMSQIIAALKEENNQLKAVVRVQNTKICYFQQIQRNYITTKYGDPQQPQKPNTGTALNPVSQLRKLQLHNYRLKQQVKRLQDQIAKMRKVVKFTNIKELEIERTVIEEQLRCVTAKLLAYERGGGRIGADSVLTDVNANKSSTNTNPYPAIKQLNKIIQKQHLLSLQNSTLQSTIAQQQQQLQQTAKILRKLKNIISQKNTQIESYKQQRQKIETIISRNKSYEDYVPKSQLIAKKKQLLAMTENTEKLEVRLLECEGKVQALQQENVDNMNREAGKRKDIIAELQKLKKSYQSLEEALAIALKKNNDSSPPLRLDKVPALDAQFRKPKVPQIVELQHIKQAVQKIIYNLQCNKIDYQSAAHLIKPQPHSPTRQASPPQHTSPQRKPTTKLSTQPPPSTPAEQTISIRQIIHCLEQPPLGLEKYEHKQVLARYLAENQSDHGVFIDFDGAVNVSYVRSVFRRVLGGYVVFGDGDVEQYCHVVYEFLRRNSHNIKCLLSKLPNQDAKKGAYRCKDYFECLVKQSEKETDSEITHAVQFIKFWTFELREANHSLKYQEFQDLFKMEGVCTFITDPIQDAGDDSKQDKDGNVITKNENNSNQNIQNLIEAQNNQNQVQNLQIPNDNPVQNQEDKKLCSDKQMNDASVNDTKNQNDRHQQLQDNEQNQIQI